MGMPGPRIDEATFRTRFLSRFADLVFEPMKAELDRYIGYWKPYATGHEELDADTAMQDEVKNAALALAGVAHANHAGKLLQAGRDLKPPRRK